MRKRPKTVKPVLDPRSKISRIKNEKNDVIDGAELQIINIFANKFDFKPMLIPAPTSDGDGGIVDTVKMRKY